MLSVYDYQKPSEFLQAAWNGKRQRNPQFTIRSWAMQMGIKHHASLHEMVNGKRKISKASVPKFIQVLGLDVTEGLFFESMVDLSRSTSAEEKTLYLERMKAIAPDRNKVKFTELESFRLLQDPIHFFIAEMALLNDFKADSLWIQKRLMFDASLERITSAIERLTALDILREDPEGRLLRVDQFVHSKSDIKDKALQEYHKNLSEIAMTAVQTQDVLEREFQAMTLNFDLDRLPEAKKVLREFLSSFVSRFDCPEKREKEIYHLNLQFFKVTQKGNRK